jgi:hypothetical protein
LLMRRNRYSPESRAASASARVLWRKRHGCPLWPIIETSGSG